MTFQNPYIVICPERYVDDFNLDNCDDADASQFAVAMENATVVHVSPTRDGAEAWVAENYPEAVRGL